MRGWRETTRREVKAGSGPIDFKFQIELRFFNLKSTICDLKLDITFLDGVLHEIGCLFGAQLLHDVGPVTFHSSGADK